MNMPSKGYVWARLCRKVNQRITVGYTGPFVDYLVREHKFVRTQPVLMNGIFAGLQKGPRDRNDPRTDTFTLEFRDVLFIQGEHEVALFRCGSRRNKSMRLGFALDELNGLHGLGSGGVLLNQGSLELDVSPRTRTPAPRPLNKEGRTC